MHTLMWRVNMLIIIFRMLKYTVVTEGTDVLRYKDQQCVLAEEILRSMSCSVSQILEFFFQLATVTK
jgi:hypothetical protein